MCEESSARLQIVFLVWVGLWTIGIVLNNFVAPLLHLAPGDMVMWPSIANYAAFGWIAISLGLFVAARRGVIPARKLSDLSLVYEVGLAFTIGVINQWVPVALAGRLSWLVVLILIHPMIVPNTPRKTLIASLLAASMDPVGLVIAKWRGMELPPLNLIVWAYLPNYVCAHLAVIPSQILLRLNEQVSRARQLGSYQLGELLGRGGMGEVWRAQHRLLARPAAIKLIRPEVLGAGDGDHATLVRRRFKREAQSAAALHSAHTIELFDFGVTKDGVFYYVMELLDGLDLDTLVRRFGPLPAERVIYLLRQACHSLADAHASGMVHRDIKPANIFVCRKGLDTDYVKVLDFGLVKADHRGTAGESMLTGADVTTGTPAYMPPEMAIGDSVDHRADIYSLGCVGYWLLTGRLVFEADSALQMVARHIQAAPLPPSRRTELPVPPELDRILLACLEKKPDARPASAGELSRMLDTVPGADTWDQERARQWWERHIPVAESQAPATPWRASEAVESPVMDVVGRR